MKTIIFIGAALIASPLAAAHPVRSLPGVSDRETTISYGEIEQSVRGHGDVIFVRDRANQWYRVMVNHGCLRETTSLDTMIFNHHGPSNEIDRFTTITIPRVAAHCSINSIRRSEAPPQVNSKSRVTLD